MSETTTAIEWSYWCPAEPVMDRDEIHVGVVAPGEGCDFSVVFIAAVVPPIAGRQNEAMARVMRDWLAAHDWEHPDGLAAWARAHGAPGVHFPAPVFP